MRNKEAYEEYKKEHPEEFRQLEALKRYSEGVEARLRMVRRQKIKKVKECRRYLYG